ncbi:hypothetical protein B0H34DRAFT_830366, partial [Crassisporium funariophilum]
SKLSALSLKGEYVCSVCTRCVVTCNVALPFTSMSDYVSARLASPPENVYLLLPSGDSICFGVFFDEKASKSLVRCDLCRKFLVLGASRSTLRLSTHRTGVDCQKRAGRQVRAWEANRAKDEAETASYYLFHNTGVSEPDSGDVTPTLTPRPSFANFRFSESFTAPTAVYGQQPENDIIASNLPFQTAHLEMFCKGQWVDWYPGSVWDTYAYQQHEHKLIPWTLVGVEGRRVRLQSKKCKKYLESIHEPNEAVCSACADLLQSPKLKRFMERASGDALPRTPWMYLNFMQIRKILVSLARKAKRYELQARNRGRYVSRLSKKLDDYKRLVMMLSQNKIAGVSTILAISLRKGESPQAIYSKMENAINGTYAPRSGWTEREFDIAFLAKALSGSRLLYVLQKAEGYPSNTTLRRRRPISEMKVSTGIPSTEVDANISAFMGAGGRKPPSPDNILIGQTLMIDGVALEETCRYEHQDGIILGVCREHSGSPGVPRLLVDGIEDIENMAKAIFADKICHHGKDGTVVAVAPETGTENYSPIPIVLSPSCKSETGDKLAHWVMEVLSRYRKNPDGERRHGKITKVATDGESSFRTMRFIIGLVKAIKRETALGGILYHLPGLNVFTGLDGLLTTCDPKHIIKRFATMIRSPAGIQLGNTVLKSDDFFLALTIFKSVTEKQASLLLSPADKQNVPQAVNLLQTLLEVQDIHTIMNPTHLVKVRAAIFFATIMGYFLFPFIKVEMTLSEQIQSLSTYSHLITAFHLRHRSGFMNNALFGDSQAIVKSIIITTARFQTIQPTIKHHILFEGTDRLEGVFSHVRTQDHARNFDVLQLAHKLSVGAEIDAIFARHPDLYKGHTRRNLSGAHGVDHVNPKSWTGDAEVGKVDLKDKYLAGRNEADRLLTDYLRNSKQPVKTVDWDTYFHNRTRDHLRPEGEYIGSRAADQDPGDDDSEELLDNLLHLADGVSTDMVQSAGIQIDSELDFVPQILNPSEETRRTTPYLTVGTRQRHIDALFAEMLVSDKARKSTIRTLRAQGVTIAETITRQRGQKIDSSEHQIDGDVIKCGDLGGFLVCVADKVCLAVGEVLNFRQGTSRNNLQAVNIDDLESGTGTKLTSVAVQVLDLSSDVQVDGVANLSWEWTENYIQTSRGKDGVTNPKHFTARLPGKSFYPLGPDVKVGRNDQPVWSLEHSDLITTLKDAWESLNPDADEIITNVELLPEIFGEGLPYKTSVGIPNFMIDNPPVQLEKLAAKDQVPCKLCGKILRLNQMRNHVGGHILRSLRTREFELLVVKVVIGLNPCGWCGLQGCKTRMTRKGKTTSISSNCAYHYSKMVYSRALISSESMPCTNVPVSCPICPSGQDQQSPTFWKYNLIHHMTENHIDEEERLPPFPAELRLSAHISRLEEERMGVELANTIRYRTQHDLMNSDALEDPMDDPMNVTVVDDESWDPSGYRKRAASVLSQASSSASRQPSSSKVQRTGESG